MRVVFMGSAEFAVPALRELLKSHEVVCVYTQPPRRKGRGMQVSPTPVQMLAEEHGIKVEVPTALDSAKEQDKLRELKADVLIVVAYGLLIPQEVLDIFPNGGLNIHPSLLPRWRGAAPIERAIEAGDKDIGVAVMGMEAALDSGAIVASETMAVDDTLTAAAYHEILSQAGAELLLSVLQDGSFEGTPQAEDGVTYAKKWRKTEALLDFNLSAEVLARKIRAADSMGGCYFLMNDERVKVWQAAVGEPTDEPIGSVSDDWQVVCGGDPRHKLCLQVLQKSGSKKQSVEEFKRAFPVPPGLNLIS